MTYTLLQPSLSTLKRRIACLLPVIMLLLQHVLTAAPLQAAAPALETSPTRSIVRKSYRLGDQPLAVKTVTTDPAGRTAELHHLYTDHLGSVRLVVDEAGAIIETQSFAPFGAPQSPLSAVTTHGYTGHRHDADSGLIYMNARWYDPALGRFLSADSLVPDPYSPQSFNRYAYVYNNPLRYTDSSGHCVDGLTTWICAAVVIGVVTKAIDYAWTAYDGWQSGRTLADPAASRGDKMMAALNIGMAALFELVEPDDLLPVGLPIDDVARRTILNGAEEALEAGGPEALEHFLRNQLGDHADDVIRKLDEALGLDPDTLYNATQLPIGKQNFTAAGHALQKHANRSGDVWAKYLPEGTLNPANYNARAGELVREVLTDPGTSRSYYKDYIEYFAPDGRGLRFNLDGSFVGFINP